MADVDKITSTRIKARRKELHMSVDYIVSRLKISRATFYRYESAEIEKIPAYIINRLANILNTSTAYLMGETDDPAPTANKIFMDYEINNILARSFAQAVERGEIKLPQYYDDDTAEMAQTLFENEDMRLLFDAAQGCTPADLKMAADLLKRLKGTNPDG